MQRNGRPKQKKKTVCVCVGRDKDDKRILMQLISFLLSPPHPHCILKDVKAVVD